MMNLGYFPFFYVCSALRPRVYMVLIDAPPPTLHYLIQEGGLIKETWMDEDPREAILKYADAAEKDPKFIAPAYSQTQPKPVFQESDSDSEEK